MRLEDSTDLTTKARIRDAAITCFARDGFEVPVRVIAEAAHVSPALVIHHFGSKANLRTECDHYVLDDMLRLKGGWLSNPSALTASVFQDTSPFDEATAYLIRAIMAGGDTAQGILAATEEATARYFAKAQGQGLLRPTADPPARARYFTYLSLGLLAMAFLARQRPELGDQPADGGAVVGPDGDNRAAKDPPNADESHPDGSHPDPLDTAAAVVRDLTLPHLELMTHGLLTTDEFLNQYLTWRKTHDPIAGPPNDLEYGKPND